MNPLSFLKDREPSKILQEFLQESQKHMFLREHLQFFQTSDSFSEPPWFLFLMSPNLLILYLVSKNSCWGTSSVLPWLLISELQTVFQDLTWTLGSFGVQSVLTSPLHRFLWEEDATPELFSRIQHGLFHEKGQGCWKNAFLLRLRFSLRLLKEISICTKSVSLL